MPEPKETLHRYLQVAREALIWKLAGLSEYDLRRPMTPTATNLLGLVKHTASVEAGYLGDCFGRPSPERFPWFEDDAEPNDDMWARPEESSDAIIDLYHRVWAHSDATIEALPLDATGHVPWWGERGDVTLHQILVHVATETHRHAGHADIVRELIDGAVGLRDGNENLPDVDKAWWTAYRDRVEAAAEQAAERMGSAEGR
ncbi:MAG: DinB family protein [Acidimicrobiia bacterium]